MAKETAPSPPPLDSPAPSKRKARQSRAQTPSGELVPDQDVLTAALARVEALEAVLPKVVKEQSQLAAHEKQLQAIQRQLQGMAEGNTHDRQQLRQLLAKMETLAQRWEQVAAAEGTPPPPPAEPAAANTPTIDLAERARIAAELERSRVVEPERSSDSTGGNPPHMDDFTAYQGGDLPPLLPPNDPGRSQPSGMGCSSLLTLLGMVVIGLLAFALFRYIDASLPSRAERAAQAPVIQGQAEGAPPDVVVLTPTEVAFGQGPTAVPVTVPTATPTPIPTATLLPTATAVPVMATGLPPVACALPEPPPVLTSALGYHRVQGWETVNCIARAYRVDPQALIVANNLRYPDALPQGHVLSIPAVPWAAMTAGEVCPAQFPSPYIQTACLTGIPFGD